MVKDVFNDKRDSAAEAAKRAVAEFEVKVKMGQLDPDNLSVAGSAVLESERHKEVHDQKKRGETVQRLLDSVNEYLERIDQIIADTEERIRRLEEQRREAVRLAEAAQARAMEAQMLFALIQDGVSDEERRRLVELLGAEAETATPEELQDMLEKEEGLAQEEWYTQRQEIKRIEDEIAFEQDLLEDARLQRASYVNSPPEEQLALEADFEDRLRKAEQRREEAKEPEPQEGLVPDFPSGPTSQ